MLTPVVQNWQALIVVIALLGGTVHAEQTRPNIVYIFGDQWRAQATGYAGDPNLQGKTPNLDALKTESVDFSNAVAGMPVCTPYRASLMTCLLYTSDAADE